MDLRKRFGLFAIAGLAATLVACGSTGAGSGGSSGTEYSIYNSDETATATFTSELDEVSNTGTTSISLANSDTSHTLTASMVANTQTEAQAIATYKSGGYTTANVNESLVFFEQNSSATTSNIYATFTDDFVYLFAAGTDDEDFDFATDAVDTVEITEE